MGTRGAKRFVELLSDKPDKRAREAVPRAAKANRTVFFASEEDQGHKRTPLTAAEVQARLDALMADRVPR